MPRVSWQVRLSLLYLWYAAAIGRSWTGRAPVVPRAKGSAWREVTLNRSPGSISNFFCVFYFLFLTNQKYLGDRHTPHVVAVPVEYSGQKQNKEPI